MKRRQSLFIFKVALLLLLGLLGPTLAAAAAPVQLPVTGQTVLYGTGDDGDLQKGVVWPVPRFSDNEDGTILDNLTGLIWAEDAGTKGDLSQLCAGGTKTWQGAFDYVACLNENYYLGYSDWILPNINELKSLFSLGNSKPVLPSSYLFTDVQQDFYWTATTSAADVANAWGVDLTDGALYVRDLFKNDSMPYVWPLRAPAGTGLVALAKTGQTTSYGSGDDGALQRGVSGTLPRYIDNDDGTVIDTLTELVWGKDAKTAGPAGCAPGVAKGWMEALTFVACLNDKNYLNHSNWRLPNYNELTSLSDYGQVNPSLSLGHPFLLSGNNSFWTSTTYASEVNLAWYVNIDTGEVQSGLVAGDVFAVWPVCGAETTEVDITIPVVSVFTLPATATSLTIPVTSFVATDNVGVTGYQITSSATAPTTWSASAPTSVVASAAGTVTFYAWARDAAGNVSLSKSATTTITLPIVIYGDVNADGATTSADALLALQIAVGKKTFDPKADLAPLLNGVPTPDNKVTAADALVILRKAVGLW